MGIRGGHYSGSFGVCGWGDTSGTVAGESYPTNGRFAVADKRQKAWSQDEPPKSIREIILPKLTDKLVCVIQSRDGTWHRPFTTLELAALQALIDPEEYLELEGLSDAGWRERIGNAVPPAAATAIAEAMGEVLLLTWAGETFTMSSRPIWVQPMVASLMAATS